jgi:hypothetical protein
VNVWLAGPQVGLFTGEFGRNIVSGPRKGLPHQPSRLHGTSWPAGRPATWPSRHPLWAQHRHIPPINSFTRSTVKIILELKVLASKCFHFYVL